MTEAQPPVPVADAGRGVRIGVDVGSVRVGIAGSDPDGILATPIATLPRDVRSGRDLDELARLIMERGAVEVIVGLPRTLRGEAGAAVEAAREYGRALAERIAPIPVGYSDERLTTVVAHQVLAKNKVRGRARRAVVDQVAAVEILQNHLERRRSGGARG